MSQAIQRIPGFLSLSRKQNESIRLGRDIYYGVKSLEGDKVLLTFYMPAKYESYALNNNPNIEFRRKENGILTATVYEGESVYLSRDIEILVNNIKSSIAKIHTKAPKKLKVTRNEIEETHSADVRAYNFALKTSPF